MAEKTGIFKILSALGGLKANNRFSVIFICLIVSVVFWFLISLSKIYSSRIIFPLKYVNMPERKMVVQDLPKSIEVTVKTTGFQILSGRFGKKEDTLAFDVAARIEGAKQINKDVMVIPSKALTADLSEKLESDYTITGFYPDSIVFNFASTNKKLVPVRLISKISFEKQFDTTGHPVMQPDSVIITGPDSLIAKINSIETSPLVLSKVKSSISADIKLKKDSFITAAPDRIKINIPVEEFTEGTVEVPVHVINVKPDYSLKTFPDKVSVHYRVPLSNYNSITADLFDAVANAAALPDNNIQQIKINLTAPNKVRMPFVVPEKVDYILRKK